MFWKSYTVKKVDEVVRHLHRVTQDQFSLVSEKVFGILEDNFTINIELFDRLLKMSNFFDRAGNSKAELPGGARTYVLQVYNLTLYHCATLSYILFQSFN
jgi:hypothetical protein